MHRLIFLVLGDGCNMDCTYCIERDKNGKAYEINEDIYQYIIDAATKDSLQAVTFYGGEPTIYFKQMKEIVERLDGYDIHFSTMTNGKAITKEMVDFFNEHNMSVNVSWDGDKTILTRGYDCFKENPNLLDINRIWLSSLITIHSYPIEIVDSAERLNKKYMEKHDHPLLLHMNTSMKAFEHEIYDIDLERTAKEMDILMRREPNGETEKAFKELVIDSISAHMKHKMNVLRKCGVGTEMNVLCADGRLFACKNNRKVVGDVHTHPAHVCLNVLALDNQLKYVDECRECDVFAYCHGGCRFLLDRKHFCATQKAVLRPVMNYIRENNL